MSFQIRIRDLALGALLVCAGLIAGLTVRPTETRAQSLACEVSSGSANSAYLICGERVFVCQGNQCRGVSFT